jgi:hypothetical protein
MIFQKDFKNFQAAQHDQPAGSHSPMSYMFWKQEYPTITSFTILPISLETKDSPDQAKISC